MTTTLNKNKQDFFLITSVILILTSANLVNLTYTIIFNDIAEYFRVLKEHIGYVPRANLFGIAIGSLFAGALADCYGRKRILLYGLSLLAIGSIIASVSTNFYIFVTSFIIMGIAKSTSMIATSTIILDKFTNSKQANIALLLIRITLLAILSLLPVLLLIMAKMTYWKIFFNVIFVFSICAFLSAKFFLKESLLENEQKPFRFLELLKDYKILLTNFRFMGNALIFSFPAILVALYMNNISLILVGTEFTQKEYSLYGSGILIINFIFSSLSIYITNKKGLNFNKNLGLTVAIIAGLGLELITKQQEHLLFFPLYLCVAGMAMMNGFFIEASKVEPKMKGLSIALVTTISNILTARSIFWSQEFYNKTIGPAQNITLLLCAITLIIFIILKRKNYPSL